jgi:hypothetical protein
MKKTIALTVLLLAVVVNTFGQADTNLLNVKKYSSMFLNSRGNLDAKYALASTSEDWDRIAALGGNLTVIDTALEIALLSNSVGVINIRPPEANAILPVNNPKQADQKLGAAVFQEIQILRFLGETAAVNRHEAVLKFITDRGNVTRAEVEAYYRNGIRALIAEIVDEEFNRISFLLRKDNRISYNAILTRNPQHGHYTLSYGGIETNDEIRMITGDSLDALSSAMRNGANRADFAQLSIDTVRTQAALRGCRKSPFYVANKLNCVILEMTGGEYGKV